MTVAILGILAAIAIPNYREYKKKPYDLWAKLELSEQSKFLKLTYSVDGFYHQYLGGTGYRPSVNLLGNAGFYTGSAVLQPCCDRYQAGRSYTYLKANSSANKAVHSNAICRWEDGGWTSLSGTCSKSKVPYLSVRSFAKHGISSAQCDVFNVTYSATATEEEENPSYQGWSVDFNEPGNKPYCDCENYTIMAVTPYNKSIEDGGDNSPLKAQDGHGIFVMNQDGFFCKAGSDGNLIQDI